jgi:hypothetical protein
VRVCPSHTSALPPLTRLGEAHRRRILPHPVGSPSASLLQMVRSRNISAHAATYFPLVVLPRYGQKISDLARDHEASPGA